MEKYGINNVRGGSFCKIKLNKENIITIKKMINASTDKCYICGSNDHFVKDCVKKDDKPIIEFIDGPCNCPTSYFSGHRKSKCLLSNTLNKISEIFDNENDIIEDLKPNKQTKYKCYRCGREGHYSKDCYANKHINGKNI